MGFYQIFILVSLIILTIGIFLLATLHKKQLTAMQGMTITMFFSMSVGLTVGLVFGGTYQGNLFLSTILAIVFSIFAGIVCGLRFGLLAMIEGFMTGIMAGMMGAMLGEMMNSEQTVILVRFFLLISIMTIFLFFILAIKETQQNISVKRWFLKPFLLSTFIIVYFVGGVPYAEKYMNTSTQSSVHNHSNEESKELTIQVEDTKYSLSEIILEKNQPVTLTLQNFDAVDHSFEVELPNRMNEAESTHHHGQPQSLIHLHVKPNNESVITFIPTESGKYEFICTIPGHKESGMVGSITVK